MKTRNTIMLGIFSVILFGFPLLALSQQGANIIQLTSSLSGDDQAYRTYSISADRSTIAFSTTADLTGQNPDGNVELFVMKSDGTGLLQITNTSAAFSDDPSLTSDGSVICFRSSASLDGPNITGANIFLVNSDGTNFRQLTDWGVTSAFINSAGTIIALYTTGNPVGENPDWNYEVFVMNPDGSGIRQLTNTTGTDPYGQSYVNVPNSFTADGNWLTMHTNANLLGTSAVGTDNLYILSTDGTVTRRLTVGHGAYSKISLDGSLITFHSYDDLLGDNHLGSPEVFVIRPDGSGLRRLTDSYGGGSSPGSITADGSVVAFFGFANLTGENPDFSEEIFIVNSDGTMLAQVTNSVGGRSISPVISNDGSFILFRSNADLVGQNPDGNFELFIAISNPNQSPVARCKDVTVSADEDGQGHVTAEEVDNGSYDPDGDTITLSLNPAGPYPLGDTTVTLTVTDDKGLCDQCTAIVTVVDETPPVIYDIIAYPYVLWPPNHKMVEVTVEVDAEDNCDPDPLCIIVEVTCNEPINGPGDGNTEPDWEIVGDLNVLLRAERSGSGSGRIYEILVVCIDASENATPGTVYVTVPHDQGYGKKGKK